ncbi:hypothetical protein LR48_Vigan10g120500 [Vigna angularis]|uniref:Uncharacterized protein n=1 Tax=Phaseolus angularis TaxID=3914 RepID=A0A0L9VJZ6_PHAAN|nr:hypothetical protein LR48_Vigan10g120500 [Vigna angularis]
MVVLLSLGVQIGCSFLKLYGTKVDALIALVESTSVLEEGLQSFSHLEVRLRARCNLKYGLNAVGSAVHMASQLKI